MSGISFRSLRAEALEFCRFRGHNMKPDTDARRRKDSIGNESAGWVCRDCGAHVYIETRPAPNSIDIHGEAVALNCGSESIGDMRSYAERHGIEY